MNSQHHFRSKPVYLLPLLLVVALAFGTNAALPAAHAEAPAFAQRPTFDPTTLFLTWQDDPTTTIAIQWIGDRNYRGLPEVWFAPANSDDWAKARALRTPFPTTPLYIYRAQLRNLSPDTDYVFRIGLNSPEYRFRTMPKSMPDRLVFVTGGDAGAGEPNRKTCIQAAAREPRFAVIGGDLAYANGKDPFAWIAWLEDWKDYMVTPKERLIPMVVTIGNHEVQGGFDGDREKAPFFFSLFKLFDDSSYSALDFGDYLSLMLLDSGHVTPVAGAQTDWLGSALEKRKNIPNVFPVYHVPAWPGYRDFDGRGRPVIRENWVPLFERFNPAAVFENDDHIYKRTVPIRAGKEDSTGVVYLGDGCWGRDPREVKDPDDIWYLAKTAARVHFIMVELNPNEKPHFTAIDNDGRVIDELKP